MKTSAVFVCFAITTLLPWRGSAQPATPAPVAIATNSAVDPVVQGMQREALEADVRGFFQQLNVKDDSYAQFDKTYYIDLARFGYYGGVDWLQWWHRPSVEDSIQLDSMDVRQLDGEKASVQLAYSIHKGAATISYKGTYDLIFAAPRYIANGRKNWRFVVAVPGDKQGLDDNPLGWGIYVLSQVPGAHDAFLRFRAKWSLLQLSLSVFRFEQDWDEVLSFDPESIEPALDPYLTDASAWNVPGTKDRFQFNTRLCGINDHDNPGIDHKHTVLFYDGVNEQAKFRYGGKTLVCFFDGQTELLDPAQFQKLRWQP